MNQDIKHTNLYLNTKDNHQEFNINGIDKLYQKQRLNKIIDQGARNFKTRQEGRF